MKNYLEIRLSVRLSVVAALLLPFLVSAGQGQTPAGLMEAGVDYSWLHANAPSGNCGCFSASGGSGNLVVNLPHAISAIGEVSGYAAGNLNGTTQNVTLLNYLFGVRYTVATHTRLRPYGQALAGGSHESSNYSFVQSVNGFASSLGGGVHLRVSKRLGINLVEADWLHSNLSNAGNDRQNDLRLSTGVYLLFGRH